MILEEPFPTYITNGLWDDDQLRAVAAEFPDPDDPRWRRYENGQERKLEGPPDMWGTETRLFFADLPFLAPIVGRMFGFDDLTMETIGGGYHYIPPGGYLGVHTDFNRSGRTNRYRVVNLLVYLNEDWQDPGGHLELWDEDACVLSVAPEFNRTVAFATSHRSWHGHPKPASRWRKSVAAYFFSAIPPEGYPGEQSTVFHPKGAVHA